MFLLFCRYSNSNFFDAFLRYDPASANLSKLTSQQLLLKNFKLKNHRKKTKKRDWKSSHKVSINNFRFIQKFCDKQMFHVRLLSFTFQER